MTIPAYDARFWITEWKQKTAAELSNRGTKTELAKWLAGGDSAKVQTWRVQINRVLNSEHEPGGNFVLAVTAWIRSRNRRPVGKPPKAKRGRVKHTYT